MTVSLGLGDIDSLRDIAERAGQEIMEVYASDFDVETKDDASPVTAADKRAEALITREIKKMTDEFPIVGEEAFSDGLAPSVGGRPFWLVDPLDGTKEFIKRNGEFTVNIALVEAGRPVVGVVHAPVLKSTYWGSHNGAFATIEGAGMQPISARPAPADGLVALVSRSHRSAEVDEFLGAYTIAEEISAGSSLKFCHVAAGRADLYPRLGRTMEWDTAAGHAVLSFAGGHVRTLEGGDLAYGKAGFENPHFVATGLESDDEDT
ncbi:MAG: 3'(2'),5'-bisphosphate nucleotidase CysQ [Rhodospirillales bacterium]|nr:3'(2'),5'-bisphosphate nucleotidase CysQ [Rhodospirillales bacterium]